MFFRRSACYLSTSYIAVKLELITPRLSGRAAPISITEKNRYTYHCTAKSLPGFTTAELYLLSVALVLPSRVTDVIRFAALWCPDFPTPAETGINKPIFSRLQRYTIISTIENVETCQFEILKCRAFSNEQIIRSYINKLPHYYYLRAIIYL